MKSPDPDFSGTVSLSNCSGALVRFASSLPDDKALILTNGHCVSEFFMGARDVVIGRASNRSFWLLSEGGEKTVGVLHASELAYATMFETDIALYRLDDSYADIVRRFGIQARTLASEQAAVGTPIKIVSGYWQAKYVCNIDAIVHEINEGKLVWHDAIRYSQPGCEVVGGTSGSPILHAVSGMVVGINNTGNDGENECALNSPCEVDKKHHFSSVSGGNYGQQTYWMVGCMGSANKLNLALPGCQLPKPQ